MDLLRQIFIRLSLNQIRTTIINDAFRETILAQRLMYYTGMSRERIAEYARAIYWIPEGERYAALSAINGEISRADKRYLPKTMLDARAIFLCDTSWSISNESFLDPVVVNLALISGVKSVQERALPNAHRPTYIFDPELINWTPVVSKQYQYHTLSKSDLVTSNVIQTVGYLHPKELIWTIDSKSIYYLRGYFQRAMLSTSDRFVAIPELDALFRIFHVSDDNIADICLFAGYFPPWIIDIISFRLNLTLIFIRPELLSRFSKQSLTFNSTLFAVNMDITKDLVERARLMLPLIEDQYPELVDYRLCLKILIGKRVDFAEVQRVDQATYLMNIVSHAQAIKLSEYPKITSVNYDLVRRVTIYGVSDVHAILLTYATEGLMRIEPGKLIELGDILRRQNLFV